MADLTPSGNPPVTAAGAAVVATNLLAAFGSLTDTQLAAVASALALIGAFIAQHYTTPTGGA